MTIILKDYWSARTATPGGVILDPTVPVELFGDEGIDVHGYSDLLVTINNGGDGLIDSVRIFKSPNEVEDKSEDLVVAPGMTVAPHTVEWFTLKEAIGLLWVQATATTGSEGVVISIRGGGLRR